MYISSLSDPVTPVLGLGVHGRVPVRVVEDDGIGSGQVDTQASTPGGEDETKHSFVTVEPLHQQLECAECVHGTVNQA